ncbi:MAG: Ran-binding zinc finger domain-containing protein [Vicinamibacteria bacterium]
MAIREGKWRCPYCSGVNRGADLACQGCGATRDEDVAFFLEEEAPEVADAGLIERARSGADWLCEHCGTSNPAPASRCAQCGVERGGARSREVRELRPEAPPPPARAPAPPETPVARAFKLGCALLLVLVAGLFAIAGYLALRKTSEKLTVAGLKWDRTITIEAFRTVRDDAWEGELPSGARALSRSRQVHHNEREQVGSERVKVGVKDLGNGFFEDVYEDRPLYRERPVYRDRVNYEIERWVPARTERAAGADASPQWPRVALGRGEREGARSESYLVLLRGAKRMYRHEVRDAARFAQFRPGEEFEAVIRGGSTVLELKPR